MAGHGMTRWEPFREMLGLHDRLNRLFNDPFGPLSSTEGVGNWIPAVDIIEEPERLIFRAEVAGVNRDDIDIQVENGTLVIRGEKKMEKNISAESVHRSERFFGNFARSFTLPTGVSADKITAKYSDGVLEVVLPKAEEAKPRKIKVLSS